jgi:hypothetical protein
MASTRHGEKGIAHVPFPFSFAQTRRHTSWLVLAGLDTARLGEAIGGAWLGSHTARCPARGIPLRAGLFSPAPRLVAILRGGPCGQTETLWL